MRSSHQDSLHAVDLTKRESHLHDVTSLGPDLGREGRGHKQTDQAKKPPTCHRHGSVYSFACPKFKAADMLGPNFRS